MKFHGGDVSPVDNLQRVNDNGKSFRGEEMALRKNRVPTLSRKGAGGARRSRNGPGPGATLLLLLAVSLLSGCGYRVLRNAGDLELSSLHAAGVRNQTMEPRLEDLLHEALVEELLRDRRVRLVPEDASAMTLQSTLTRFRLRATAESDSSVTQYEIELTGNFRVVDNRTGDTVRDLLGLQAPIRETFSVDANVTLTRVRQEEAEERATRSLARELAARILLN